MAALYRSAPTDPLVDGTKAGGRSPPLQLLRFGQNFGNRRANFVICGLVNPPHRSRLINQHQSGRIDGALPGPMICQGAGAISFHRLLLGVRKKWKRGLEFLLGLAGFLRSVDTNG